VNKRPQKPHEAQVQQGSVCALIPHLKLWDIKGLTHFWRGNAPRLGRGNEPTHARV
jgi:hypothetical protein